MVKVVVMLRTGALEFELGKPDIINGDYGQLVIRDKVSNPPSLIAVVNQGEWRYWRVHKQE